jgi:hypothetical protein
MAGASAFGPRVLGVSAGESIRGCTGQFCTDQITRGANLGQRGRLDRSEARRVCSMEEAGESCVCLHGSGFDHRSHSAGRGRSKRYWGKATCPAGHGVPIAIVVKPLPASLGFSASLRRSTSTGHVPSATSPPVAVPSKSLSWSTIIVPSTLPTMCIARCLR